MAQRLLLGGKDIKDIIHPKFQDHSLAPKTQDRQEQINAAEKLPLVPQTRDQLPLGPQTRDQHALVPQSSDQLPLVPYTLNQTPPSNAAQRFALGKMPLHKRDRPMFALSDDRVMLERILKVHNPDMIPLDADALLNVVKDIFSSPVPTIDDASKTLPGFKDYTEHGSLEACADLIEQITCEIECKCVTGGEAHAVAPATGHLDGRNATTFTILHLVSKYRWDAKLVLILAALAVKFGVFLLLAQTFATSQLTKSLAFIKQLPLIFAQPAALIQSLEKTRVLMKDMVDLTETVIKIYKLPQRCYNTDAFNNHIPMAVYWTVRSVLACAVHISTISGFERDQIMSFVEISELYENSERLRNMNAYLTRQWQKCLEEMSKIEEEEDYQLLIHTIEVAIHVDITTPLSRFFRPVEYLYHGPGIPKKRAGLEALRQKHVLLFISDQENLQEELFVLEHIYNEAWQQSFEIVWVLVPGTQWTDQERTRFEALYSGMRWYIQPEPWLLRPAAMRYIKERWNFKKKPILVALDPRGKVACKNAFPMVWIWQSLAYPFTSSRERDLWAEQEQAWNLEFFVDGTDPATLNWIAEGRYVVLYGGEDIEWIRKFTARMREVAVLANVPLEMVYVGKRQPKERTVQRIIDIIRLEKLSHTLQDVFQVWYFWIRIESMWESRQNVLKNRQLDEKESFLQDITTLLGYGGEAEGWALISRASEELVRAKGSVFYVCISEFDKWKVHIPEKGFLAALKDHLLSSQPPHHCNRFLLPAATGLIPESLACAECGRPMEKYFMYQCCTE